MKSLIFILVILFISKLEATLIKGKVIGNEGDYFILKSIDYFKYEHDFEVIDTIYIKDNSFEKFIPIDSLKLVSIFNSEDVFLFGTSLYLLKNDTLEFNIEFFNKDVNHSIPNADVKFISGNALKLNNIMLNVSNDRMANFIPLFQEGTLASSFKIYDSLYTYYNNIIQESKNTMSPTVFKYLIEQFISTFNNMRTEFLLRKVYFASHGKPFLDTIDLSYMKDYKNTVKTYTQKSGLLRFADLLNYKATLDTKNFDSNDFISQINIQIEFLRKYFSGYELDLSIYHLIKRSLMFLSTNDELSKIKLLIENNDKINCKNELMNIVKNK